jgi:hypothetical protein
MGNASLIHRGDCHANGVGATAGVAVKGDLGPINLCLHHLNAYRQTLEDRGWVVESLRDPASDDCDTKVVPA